MFDCLIIFDEIIRVYLMTSERKNHLLGQYENIEFNSRKCESKRVVENVDGPTWTVQLRIDMDH